MKKLLSILILLLLAGCAGQGTGPAPQASPQEAVATLAPTAEAAATLAPTAEAAATPAPTAQPEQQITIGVSVEDTAVPTPVPTPSPTATAAPTDTPTPTPTDGPLIGFIIGVDPGHQLVYDPAPEPVAPGSRETKQKVAGGCRGVKSGVYEYEVNQDVSLLLRDMLQEAGAMVVLTHDVLDVNISNIQRAQMFNEAQVDLGIRIHCNNGGSERKYTGAFMLVPTENRTKFYEQNVEAAKTILAAYCEETGLPTRYKDGITYRSDQTGFNWCERPIVTIEMGHLSNPAEDALLSDPEFQVKMARGLFNGILRYFRPDLVAAANE